MKSFDVIVIGSGSAGFSAAETAKNHGKKVCLIESGTWGGECPNYACVPTKAMLKSAEMYHQVKKDAKAFGVNVSGVTFNFKKIMSRKQDIVNTVTGDGKRLLEISKQAGIETVKGRAKFESPYVVSVGSKKYKAKTFVLATGAVDRIPPIEGMKDVPYMTYKDVVQLQKQPKSIAIIGGGPVGCEFATFFGMLESKVHLFQLSSRILHREDAEVSLLAKKHLEEKGVKVQVNSSVEKVQKIGRKIQVTYVIAGKKRKVTVDALILAAGKRPNLDRLQLEKADVQVNKEGKLVLNNCLQTNQSHIFSAGDVTAGMMFTHTAHEQGAIAGLNAVQKTKRTMQKADFTVVPRVTFVSPEVASVGMTPLEAHEAKKQIVIAAFPVGSLSRAVTESKREGIVKLVIDKKTRKILGAHILAARAGEMIHEIALAMHKKVTVDELADIMHAFPTYSEAIVAAASRA